MEQEHVRIGFDLGNPTHYHLFLRVKALPRVRFEGRTALVPAEYAHLLDLPVSVPTIDYTPEPFLYDYQRDISTLAIRKKRFAVYAQCGLGKTLIATEFAKHVAGILPPGQCVLILSPLNMIRQTLQACRDFYADRLTVEHVLPRNLPSWVRTGRGRIGITNYESLTDSVPRSGP